MPKSDGSTAAAAAASSTAAVTGSAAAATSTAATAAAPALGGSTSNTGDSQFVAINPAAFSGGFSGANLLAYLAKDVLKQKYGQSRNLESGTAPAVAKASLDQVRKLVQTLNRAEVELLQLHREVSKKVSYLQGTFNQQETKHRGEVEAVMSSNGAVRESFRKLEGCMNRVSQIGTRIGDRLQTADSLRTRALQLVEVMSYLRQFSELDEDSSDFKRTLPPVFWEDGGLHEAAVLTRRLLAMTVEAMGAKQRSKLLQVSDDAADASTVKGSLDYTYARLQQYSGWLEARMVARFDRALEKDNLDTMAECTKVMAEFGRGKTITQRYVSTHPMLMLSEDEALAPFPSRSKGHANDGLRDTLKPLDQLFEELLGAVQDEATRMVYIFPEPKPAMDLLVQRMFEERVKPAVDRLLGRDSGSPSTPGSTSGEEGKDGDSIINGGKRSASLRSQLVATTEVYIRTRTFMEAVQAAAVPPLGPLDLALARDSLFGQFLAAYPQPELEWLLCRYEEEVEAREIAIQLPPAGPPPAAPSSKQPIPPPPQPLMVLQVDAKLADLLMACHGEALQRAQLLSASEAQLAKCVRRLFHGEGPFAPFQGSLLQQIAHLVLDGVEQSLDLGDIRDYRSEVRAEVEETLATRELMRQELMIARYEAYMDQEPLPEAPRLQDIDRATSNRVGQAFVGRRIHPVLSAAHQSSAIMTRLQQHYAEEVAPRLSLIAELGICSNGLLAVLRAAEEGVLLVLRKAAETMIIQVEKLLMLEQRAAEFLLRAEDVEGASFSRPTNACRLVCSHLSALHREAVRQLEGNNLMSFMSEVGNRVHAVFLHHIQQFVFSPHGALRLKADVNEYTECIKAMDLPTLLEKFSNTQVLANILVVAPDSLLALVNGTLRMPHREALTYVRLREDFETAVVGGKSLEQLFSSDNKAESKQPQAGLMAPAASFARRSAN